MQLVAKNILPDKFWIVETPDRSKIGTIQVDAGSVRVIISSNTYTYKDFDTALSELNISTSAEPVADNSKKKSYKVNEYPAKDEPFNEIYDAKLGLPMYTKSERSRCFYAAGYYIIHFDYGWSRAFCPKVITLKRNEFKGPYKTELEMKEQHRLSNNG